MTWSYSGDPSSSELDEIRFLIGDTLEREMSLSDEEITYVMNKTSNKDALLSQIYGLIAAKCARLVTEELGPQKVVYSDLYKRYVDLQSKYAKKLERAVPTMSAEIHAPLFKIDMIGDAECRDRESRTVAECTYNNY